MDALELEAIQPSCFGIFLPVFLSSNSSQLPGPFKISIIPLAVALILDFTIAAFIAPPLVVFMSFLWVHIYGLPSVIKLYHKRKNS